MSDSIELPKLVRMPVVEERKISKSGSSLIITLPKAWIADNDLKEGDSVIVVANGKMEVMKKTEENISKVNKDITEMRNHISYNSQLVPQRHSGGVHTKTLSGNTS